ncbi:MAG: ATP-binding cassette domain-containing protein [Desulfofustis sp.]|nr:ATP-binding cassette domain-containing protein [Desulfofustis sp.]
MFTLHHRGGAQVCGFRDLDLEVAPGQLLALYGPSGAGKSSVLKSIYRTYRAQAGSVRFSRQDGSVVDLVNCPESKVLDLRRREIAFVTQFLKTLPRISALDVVAQPLVELGEPAPQARRRATDLLGRLGIREELLTLSPLTFSGGEQQRVNIARAVIAPKELILLDEPTASLDRDSSDVVLGILGELKKQGIAMIAIFHDQNKIERVADAACRIDRNSR